MKKYIRKQEDYSDDLAIELSDIEGKAYRLGYQLTVDNMQVFLKIKNDKSNLPEILVTTVPDGDSYIFNVRLRFPEIDSENTDIGKIMPKWNQVVSLVNDLILFEYEPTEEDSE